MSAIEVRVSLTTREIAWLLNALDVCERVMGTIARTGEVGITPEAVTLKKKLRSAEEAREQDKAPNAHRTSESPEGAKEKQTPLRHDPANAEETA